MGRPARGCVLGRSYNLRGVSRAGSFLRALLSFPFLQSNKFFHQSGNLPFWTELRFHCCWLGTFPISLVPQAGHTQPTTDFQVTISWPLAVCSRLEEGGKGSPWLPRLAPGWSYLGPTVLRPHKILGLPSRPT